MRRQVTVEDHQNGQYTVSTDPALQDVPAIHRYLETSYWAEGIPLETVRRSVESSLCFGLYGPPGQIGLVRVISDRATFAYLCDVYVLPDYRGRGLGRWLLSCVMGSPELHGLRRWMLVTRDAHRLYQQVGFRPLSHPARVMEITRPGMYRSSE